MADELDALTLARARRGDASALSALVRHYERRVFALVSRLLCGRRHLAVEDVAQEAFVRIVRGIHRYDPAGPAQLSTWILTIATRTCLNSLRSRPREEPAAEPPERPGTAASPEELTLDREREERVTAAMAALPEDMRAVLVLRAFHDLDYPEIAAALELEVGTVKSRLSRARAALRDVIDRQEKQAKQEEEAS
jgi:RNA polymerase sigma-70 factor, ECF subfamily